MRMLLVVLVLTSWSCGKPKDSTGTMGIADQPEDVTLSGTLVGGTVSRAASGPLAAYELDCVTFSTPPVSASATADSAGRISLIMARDVAFGCFVLDTGGKRVAGLSFSSGADEAQTLTLSDSSDLGAITVDTASGLAAASVGDGATLVTTTPADTPCPLGSWSFTQSVNCNGESMTITGRYWIVQEANGNYLISSIYDPWPCAPSGAAIVHSTATFSGNVMTIAEASSEMAAECSASQSTATIQYAADCKSATLGGTITHCADCYSPSTFICKGGCGGTVTCPLPTGTSQRK
jgi:hypothetical protein